jgi:hypothetical protein
VTYQYPPGGQYFPGTPGPDSKEYARLKNGDPIYARTTRTWLAFVNNAIIPAQTNAGVIAAGLISLTESPDDSPGTGTGLASSAWANMISEIIGRPGLTKFLVAGYFGAKQPSGCAQNVWALNPLITLDAGSLGNGLACEVDVNNNQADSKGEGVVITGNSAFNPFAALHIKRDGPSDRWNTGVLLERINTFGFVLLQDLPDTHAFQVDVASGLKASYVYSAFYNNLLAMNIQVDTGVPTLFFRNRGVSPGDALMYFNADETQPMVRLGPYGLYFGPGGSTPPDTDLLRIGANHLKTDDTFQAGGGYKSADGTDGVGADVTVADGGGGTIILHFKNGLYVGYS